MSFSNEWNEIYLNNEQMSTWPWSDLVSLVHRYGDNLISTKGNVLELGCGAGANIPFFRALGINYYCVDGSPSIINYLKFKYPELSNQIVCADFTKSQPFNKKYDLIFDRAALTHNNTASIKCALDSANKSLNSGGIYIGVDYFSTKHSDFDNGSEIDDPFTRSGYADGQFVGCGKVHFFDESHIREIFSDFEIIYLSEKVVRELGQKEKDRFASWNIVAKKV